MGKFQEEVAEWARKNFGECQPWQPYAGLMEEVAEFLAPNHEMTASERLDAMRDAIGDQCIYVANLCQMLDIDYDELSLDLSAHYTERELMGALGLGWRALLKHSQGIRGYDDTKRTEQVFIALSIWMRWAKWVSHAMHLGEVDRIANETWSQVLKRDWKAHPTDAHLHA